MHRHILLVDDDPEIAKLITEYLGEFDIRVSHAADGAAMTAKLEGEAADLILLDVRLPGEDGIELMRCLRTTTSVPIILLTTRAEEVDRILGLELGADDYVIKPFSPRELLARIRTVLRRSQNAAVAVPSEEVRFVRFGGWEVALHSGRLTSPSGERVQLTRAEARLLGAFLKAPGRTLSRDQLLDLSRGQLDDVFDRSIDVHILRLRRKLEADPSRPRLIKTERGVGYYLDAKIEVAK